MVCSSWRLSLGIMETYVVRVWLPDRPGALGQVASRIVRPVLRAAGMPDGVADAPERPAGPEPGLVPLRRDAPQGGEA